MNSAGNGSANPSWKHARPALESQLFLVAMDDAMTLVKRLGFNPTYHEHLRRENNPGIASLDAEVDGTSRVMDALGTDLMLFHVIAFVAQMKHLTDTCEKLRKRPRGRLVMKEILKRTLQEKFSDDDSVDLAGFMDDEHDNGFDLAGFMNKMPTVLTCVAFLFSLSSQKNFPQTLCLCLMSQELLSLSVPAHTQSVSSYRSRMGTGRRRVTLTWALSSQSVMSHCCSPEPAVPDPEEVKTSDHQPEV